MKSNLIGDTRSSKDRLQKGDAFQRYDGEPTTLGIVMVASLIAITLLLICI
jgi:hypothetical protein